MKKILSLLFISLITVSFLSADLYVKKVKQADPYEIMGRKRPGRVEIQELWLAKDKFAIVGQELSIIFNKKREKLYLIVPPAKMYFEIPLGITRENLNDHFPPKIVEIIKSIRITDVKVTLNTARKKIANWDCQKSEFEMTILIPALNAMPRMKMVLWATKDLSVDYQDYLTGMAEVFKWLFLNVLDIDDNSRKELEKLDQIEGFQVAGEGILKLFGANIREEEQCLEISEKPAPPGIYEVPKGYRKRPIR